MTRRRSVVIPIAVISVLTLLICVLASLCSSFSVVSAENEAATVDTDNNTVSVIFIVDGKEYAVQEVVKGGTVDFDKIKDPKKDSDDKYTYSFGGWFLDEDGKVKFDKAQAVWNDTTLYAKIDKVAALGLGEAAVDAVLGFIIVVSVLALLVGIFYLSGRLFRTKALSKDNIFEFKKKNVACDPVYVPEITDDGDELETVAAITAALSVVLEEENGGEKPEFVIRRITRKK